MGATLEKRIITQKAAVTREQVYSFAYGAMKPIIRIYHHKTGAQVDHPLEEKLEDGTVMKFYEDAEGILAKVPRRGVSMILREIEKGKSKPFAFATMQHKVQKLRDKLGLPKHFTFDTCRHGGMTELEEAELTDGRGRALSAHKTQASYIGYAKRTERRVLSATRKRHAHVLADRQIENEPSTSVRNDSGFAVRNDTLEQKKDV